MLLLLHPYPAMPCPLATAEADREVILQASKQADKAARRREQPTAEDRKRALQKKRREEREARELAEAHARAKVVRPWGRCF